MTREPSPSDTGSLPNEIGSKRLTREQDNLRAALEWSYDAGENDILARMVELLYAHWTLRSMPGEARLWLERAVEAAPAGHLHRKLIGTLARVVQREGDLDRATELVEEALELNRAAGDKVGIAACLAALSSVASDRGDYVTAAARLAEAGVLLAELGDAPRRAGVQHDEGLLALLQGDTERARRLLEGELEIRETGRARWPLARGNALADLGYVALVDRRHRDAVTALREALAISRDLGSVSHIVYCVMWIATIAQRRGDLDRGARLAAAAERLRSEHAVPIEAYAHDVYDATLAAARTRSEAWHEGCTLPLEQAIADALTVD